VPNRAVWLWSAAILVLILAFLLWWFRPPYWVVFLGALLGSVVMAEAVRSSWPTLGVDAFLQRAGALATVAGVIGLYIAFVSFDVSMESLEYTRRQYQPQLKGSGTALLGDSAEQSRLDILIINVSSVPAENVAVHFEAVFKGRKEAVNLPVFRLPGRLDGKASSDFLRGSTATKLFYDSLVGEVHARYKEVYKPVMHGPAHVVAILEYEDITGYKYGGMSSATKKRGEVRIDIPIIPAKE
jgi:hypothetical protein